MNLLDVLIGEPESPRQLDDVRSEMAAARLESVGTGTTNFDGAPTGAGKSFADIEAIRKAETSLTVLQTHRGCRETVEVYSVHGVIATAYPELNNETCVNYTEATQAIEAGLSASSAVCPGCESFAACDYRAFMEEAEQAANRVATHRRAALGFESLSSGVEYISIHEDAIDLCRPANESARGFDRVARVASEAGQAARERSDNDQRYFCWLMEQTAEWLRDKLANVNETTALRLPTTSPPPLGVDRALYRAMTKLQVYPSGEAMRTCRALAAGELSEIVIRVDRVFAKGGGTAVHRSVVAVWQTKLPKKATVWFSDATADFGEVAAMIDRPLIDKTPGGRVELQHSAEQIPLDIKISSSPSTIIKTVRGVLAAYPDHRKIGVITHQTHISIIRGTSKKRPVLDKHLRSRIVRVEHFRSGLSRGSNHWTRDCDMIVVLGTPRVPPEAVKTRLIQRGRVTAATRDGDWIADWWSGKTTDGRRITVRGAGYRDPDWHHAHQSVVRAELLQAVGRGRGICPDGIPVVVLSNENLELQISNKSIEPISDEETEMLKVIKAIRL